MVSGAVRLQLPATLTVGAGASRQAGEEARRLGLRRVLLVADPYLVASGVAGVVQGDLEAAGVRTAVFAGVEPDPDLDVVRAGLDAVRELAGDGIVALGGGSAIDAAKAMAVMATNDGPLSGYMGYHRIPRAGLPVIAIPTTAGTGSEVTRVTVITDRARSVKMMIFDGHLLPAAALVDYELSLSCPRALTAAVGVDSLTHALEAYVSKKANPFSDMLAMESGRLIGKHLSRAYRDPEDRVAREAMMLGATLGGMAFSNASLGLVHGMSRPIGAYFHVPHGLSNAMLLPAVTRFSLAGNPERYAAFGNAAGLGGDMVAGLETLNRELAVPTLREYGVGEGEFRAAIPRMAEDALASGSPGLNPRVPERHEIEALYKEVYVFTGR